MAAFALVLQRAFKTIRPIFRERAKINAEVTGRLTESLGGVRVVKGYHAESSEANVFAGGVARLLNNVISSLTAQSLMTLSSTVMLGIVGAVVMWMGAHQNAAGKLTPGAYFCLRNVPRVYDRTDGATRRHRNAAHGSHGRPRPHDARS